MYNEFATLEIPLPSSCSKCPLKIPEYSGGGHGDSGLVDYRCFLKADDSLDFSKYLTKWGSKVDDFDWEVSRAPFCPLQIGFRQMKVGTIISQC